MKRALLLLAALLCGVWSERSAASIKQPTLNVDDENDCELSEELLEKISGSGSSDWFIDDEMWELLDGDLQSVIECTQPEDKMIIEVSGTRKTSRTMTVDHSLQIVVNSKNEQAKNAQSNVQAAIFSCPDFSPLFIIRNGSFSLSGIHIEGCSSIESNSAMLAKSGATVVLENTMFSNNGVRALFAEPDTKVTVQSSVFSNNSMRDAVGGIICMDNGGSLSILGSTFRENKSVRPGGALYTATNGSVAIKQTNFSGNIAYNGAALFVEVDVKVDIDQSRFTGNTAYAYGGTLYCYYYAQLTIASSVFQNNQAHRTLGRGGAINLLQNTNTRIENCTFAGNLAGRGGALCLAPNSQLAISASVLQGNQGSDVGGGVGGAIHSYQESVVNISESLLLGNRAYNGGALSFSPNATTSLTNTTFSGNEATNSGGVMVFSDTAVVNIDSCSFQGMASTSAEQCINLSFPPFAYCSLPLDNMAHADGGVMYFLEGGEVTIIRSEFAGNQADSKGGAIGLKAHTQMTITESSFTGNKATVRGGAIFLSELSSIAFLGCDFEKNKAEEGGCLYGDSITLNLETSIFTENEATENGGCFCLSNGKADFEDCRVVSNHAVKNGGAIYGRDGACVLGNNTILESNSADESGGGIAMISQSQLFCRKNWTLLNNEASAGGGIFLQYNIDMKTRSAIYQSTFQNNKASSHGGGLVFRVLGANKLDSEMMSGKYARLILQQTRFVDNYAEIAGGAVLLTDPLHILSYCEYSETMISDNFKPLPEEEVEEIDIKNICAAWTGNKVSSTGYGPVIGAYGRDLVLSLDSNDEARLIGSHTTGFTLDNVRGGEPFPSIIITSLDLFGNAHAVTLFNPDIVNLFSPQGLFKGNISVPIENRTGQVSEIVGFKPPGNYLVQFIPNDNSALRLLNINVVVHGCRVNEEPTEGRLLCQSCGPGAYNFNITKVGGCQSCPKNANCSDLFIIPSKDYWHKSPCHSDIQECLLIEACDYENRHGNLTYLTRDQKDCDMSESSLEAYGTALCNEGYEGPLCGSCSHSYGRSSGLRCLKCPSDISAVFSILSSILYLMATAYLTISGSLPRKANPQDLESVQPLTSHTTESAPDQSNPPDEEIQTEVRAAISATVASQEQDVEVKTWKTTEVLKILLNFVQQTAIAATINVGWSDKIMNMFEASDFVGALSTAAASKPIDCLFSSNSKDIRSVWRTLTSVLIPITVIVLYAIVWGVVAVRQKKDVVFYWRRTFLSLVAVTYISYLGMTKIAVKVFYCIDVDLSKNPANKPEAETSLWAIDTTIECFGADHFKVVSVGLLALIAVTICFPLSLALILYKNQGRSQDQQSGSFSTETMGFMFRAYKKEYAYWECLVMIRKALLSVIVVFSYSFGGQIQGTLASIVFLYFLYLHIICFPYDTNFDVLNYYESGSLLISSTTLLIAQLFDSDKPDSSIKDLLAILVLVLNIVFFVFLLFNYLRSMIAQWRAVLKHETTYVSDETPWWMVVKFYIVNELTSLVKLGSSLSMKIPLPSRSADD